MGSGEWGAGAAGWAGVTPPFPTSHFLPPALFPFAELVGDEGLEGGHRGVGMAAGAFLIAGILWALGRRLRPLAVFGSYLLLSGAARLLAEVVRINPHVLLGLTEAQLIGIVSIILGVALILRDAFHPAVAPSDAPVGSESAVLSSHPVGR